MLWPPLKSTPHPNSFILSIATINSLKASHSFCFGLSLPCLLTNHNTLAHNQPRPLGQQGFVLSNQLVSLQPSQLALPYPTYGAWFTLFVQQLSPFVLTQVFVSQPQLPLLSSLFYSNQLRCLAQLACLCLRQPSLFKVTFFVSAWYLVHYFRFLCFPGLLCFSLFALTSLFVCLPALAHTTVFFV